MRTLLIVALLSLPFALLACGEEELIERDPAPSGRGGEGGEGGEGGGFVPGLIVEGGGRVEVFAGKIIELPVRLAKDGEPRPGETIDFQLPAQAFGASLLAVPLTDADGRTAARLVAGAGAATLELHADFPGAQGAIFQLVVNDRGTLEVRPTGDVPAATSVVGIYRSELGCQVVTAEFQPAPIVEQPGLPGGMERASVPAGGTTVAGVRYLDESGALVGWGCVDGLLVVAGETSQVDVPMMAR